MNNLGNLVENDATPFFLEVSGTEMTKNKFVNILGASIESDAYLFFLKDSGNEMTENQFGEDPEGCAIKNLEILAKDAPENRRASGWVFPQIMDMSVCGLRQCL